MLQRGFKDIVASTATAITCIALLTTTAAAAELDDLERDEVGDLNAPAVAAGDFPGAIKLPDLDNISLAIGGFVKAVAIQDSDAEIMGADLLPALLGTSRDDTDGQFSIDSTLSRFHVDGRAPVPNGRVRAYIEYDLNADNNGSADFKLRHAYGKWYAAQGTLTVGHTWSAMMDLAILPEGLTEPTVSGVIFQRQPIISWEQGISKRYSYIAAIEDPSSNDVFSDQPSLGTTSVPDVVLGARYQPSSNWHLQLSGIRRRIEISTDIGDFAETGYGFALTGGVNLFERDRLVFSYVGGKGLGRYLLGIQSTAGGAIDSATGISDLRENSGGMVGYKRQWSQTMRSTAMVGTARAEPLDWQTGDIFERSQYASVNLMWQAQRFITLGVELAYANRENIDGSDFNNTRIAFGIQVF